MGGEFIDLPIPKEYTKNGVDPEVRKAVIRGIIALAIVAALIWAYLLVDDSVESGQAVANPVLVVELADYPEYNSQGWPIVRNANGEVVQPEDLGRERKGCGG